MRKTCCSQGKVRSGIVLLSMEREEREKERKRKRKRMLFLLALPLSFTWLRLFWFCSGVWASWGLAEEPGSKTNL